MSGPLPTYQPRFPPEEVAQARQIVRQPTAPYMQVQRAKRVVILSKAPRISTRALAEQGGVHYHTAWKWRKRWTQEGFTLEDHPRSGRPPAFSPCAGGFCQGYRLPPARRKRASFVPL